MTVKDELQQRLAQVEAELEQLKRQNIDKVRSSQSHEGLGTQIAALEADRDALREAIAQEVVKQNEKHDWLHSREYKDLKADNDAREKHLATEALEVCKVMDQLIKRVDGITAEVKMYDKNRRKLDGDNLFVSLLDSREFMNYRMAMLALKDYRARKWPGG